MMSLLVLTLSIPSSKQDNDTENYWLGHNDRKSLVVIINHR